MENPASKKEINTDDDVADSIREFSHNKQKALRQAYYVLRQVGQTPKDAYMETLKRFFLNGER